MGNPSLCHSYHLSFSKGAPQQHSAGQPEETCPVCALAAESPTCSQHPSQKRISSCRTSPSLGLANMGALIFLENRSLAFSVSHTADSRSVQNSHSSARIWKDLLQNLSIGRDCYDLPAESSLVCQQSLHNRMSITEAKCA